MEDASTGLFGKLPAHGDFVRRGLPRGFVAAWDDWLSAGIAASRGALGQAWDDAWESAPAWRFRLAPGACGPDAAVGVMVTSQDTVGRRFPLTLAAVTQDACAPPDDAWFAAMEDAALRGRAGEMDADGLLALLPMAPPPDPDATLDGRSLFWTAGGTPIRMPPAEAFASLLGAPRVADDEAIAPASAAEVAVPADDAEASPCATPPREDIAPAADSEPYQWAEAVDLPWATPPQPRNPEAGADA
ncbi:type VI secretion system-associated protein TagF [Humitalea sp. 24SJ18S-53]|uniref:type VI secretion system-associated protein TagF n=1 Tax=Humitalea sp. 24SJ18S-53 TaxID=3422307 RepID=UPI003D672541